MKPIGLKIINNIEYLNGHELSKITEHYQTPLYVIDEKQLRFNITEYLDNFKSSLFDTHVVYASKALLTKDIAIIMNEYNMHMDCVSLGDLYVAFKSGFNMNNIVFHGNNKSTSELFYALTNQVGIIVVDNYQELIKLSDLALQHQITANIMIRVNPGVDVHTHEYIQTSKIDSKFGESIYDLDLFYDMIYLIKKNQYLNLLGLHAHIGSNVCEVEAYKLEIEKMVDFINYLNNEYHLSLEYLNIGGGIGIRYTKEEKSISIKEMVSTIVSYLESNISKTNSLLKHIYIEPGRSIVGNAGITLYTISQIKKTYGAKNYLFIDGGMTDNIRPALYNATYEVDVLGKRNCEKNILVDVVGKCCESGDIIRKDVLVPSCKENDILVVYATGAYNYSMFSNYNNMLKPALILVGDEIKVLSKREKLEDLMRLF